MLKFTSIFRLLSFCRREQQEIEASEHLITKPVANEKGQVLLIGLLVVVGLTMISISVANIGMMVAEKIQVQDATDAAAYSAAVAEARYMNLAAYMNRTIIANYNAMAFNTSLWAVSDSTDHGLASVAGVMYVFAGVLQATGFLAGFGLALDQAGSAVDGVHKMVHSLNQEFKESFGQHEGATDVNQYIEMMNTDIISTFEGIMFAALQSARYRIAEDVAKKVDPEVKTTTVLGLGAEVVSADELSKAIEWVIKDPDSRDAPLNTINEVVNNATSGVTDSSKQVRLLGALTEASLDKFTAGRTREGDEDALRNFNVGNIIGDEWWKDAIEWAFYFECLDECWDFDCDCDPELSITLGAKQRWAYEDKIDPKRVPIIARKRMRQVNQWGISMDLLGTGSRIGGMETINGTGAVNFSHTSGEYHNDIQNVANQNETFWKGEWDRWEQCNFGGSCNLNSGSALLSVLASLGLSGLGLPFGAIDDHWDGSYDAPDVCGVRLFNLQNLVCDDNYEYWFEYVLGDEGFEDGVPKYDWVTDLDNVGFANYVYQEADVEPRAEGNSRDGGGDNNNFEGPSIAVVGHKRAEDVNGLRGLGIGNDYPIVAMSRAQVYYLTNPNRPDEKPSLFNPHWVARLAPIDSEATPRLLREGLPFVGSMGVPIAPTH